MILTNIGRCKILKNAVVIYGGPRRNSNTERLLDKFISSIDINKISIDKIILEKLNIYPCTSCYGCGESGECIIEDDMGEVYKKIKSSDIIVLASPIYFAGVSAITKSMIDRCQAFWSGKFLANLREEKVKKSGYFISTAGSNDENVFKSAEVTVKLFFAACDAVYKGGVFAGNTDKVNVENNINALEEAVILGREISK